MRIVKAWLLCLVLGCGSDPAGPGVRPDADVTPTVDYRTDIKRIFVAKCIACHHTDGAISTWLDAPFDSDHGIINRENSFPKTAHRLIVVPGKPEQSFLIDKVTAKTLDHDTEGDVMPFHQPAVTAAEIASIRTWITNGAKDDDFFKSKVAPIFGTALKLDERGGKCVWCHSPGSAYAPDLLHPFDAKVGVVNVAAIRAKGLRVEPGKPEASLLFRKIGGAPLAADEGFAMPMEYERLTSDEVQRLETWIREGAQGD